MNKKGLRQAQIIILSRRLELWFTPLLVIAPLVIGILILVESIGQGVVHGMAMYGSEFLLGCIILVGTLVFDVPFLRTMRFQKRKK
jgi:hypothetical protein